MTSKMMLIYSVDSLLIVPFSNFVEIIQKFEVEVQIQSFEMNGIVLI